jgi:protein-disulfide isomerase
MKRLILLAALLAACTPAESATRKESTEVVQQRLSPADSAAAEALLARADKARIQGDEKAPIWIIEVSDFQCPYCKMWHDSAYAVIKREFITTGQVRLAYVNYPVEGHENAVPAAETAMCSALQDKFWVMHDALFDTQDKWAHMPDPTAHFDGLAQKAGVSVPALKECRKGGVMRRLITGDKQRGQVAGVNSTPSFFVGDEVIRGAAPAQAFRDAIKKVRAKAAASKKP